MNSTFRYFLICAFLMPHLIYSQDAVISTKISLNDSLVVESVLIKADVDLKIQKLSKELDSLYSYYKFQNPSVLNNLRPASEVIKSYVLDLINNGGFDKSSEFNTEVLYSKKFKNSSLGEVMGKYINSINNLDLNPDVKKNVVKKIHPLKNPDALNSFTNKYNKNVTALKKHLIDILWSEIYIIDNENIIK